MTTAPTGVLVMAYGTPARPEDVEAYYTHIRRGRPPEPEQLADLQRRYDAYYAQCMYALGNQVPGRVTYRTPRYPPPNTPPPPGLAGSPVAPRAVPGAAAPGVPPADAALPGNYPPPDTPPPPRVASGTRRGGVPTRALGCAPPPTPLP